MDSVKLVKHLRELASGGLAIAFSGGLDSMVLLQLCGSLGLEVLAVHCTGQQFASEHAQEAIAWLKRSGIPHKIVSHCALDIPEVRQSRPRRCYYCKTRLIQTLREAAESRTICDGTHAGDISGYRPGFDALREQKVVSPFLEAGFTKQNIREMAEFNGMLQPKFSGQNCLLTRFEYGRIVQNGELQIIDAAEADLTPVLALPFRLRFLKSGPELHVEAPASLPGALEAEIANILACQGLAGTPIRTMPKVSGYFDKAF